MEGFTAGWYLLYTRPRYEKKVAKQLEEKKIHNFLPVRKKLVNWSDRVKIISEPMFPSYVFIHLVKSHEYFEGCNTDGVLTYVRFGSNLARVQDSIIHDLKIVAEHGQNIEVSFSAFETGQKLLISEGALAGLNCEMVQYNKNNKALVRLSLLQRSIIMELPDKYLLHEKAADKIMRDN